MKVVLGWLGVAVLCVLLFSCKEVVSPVCCVSISVDVGLKITDGQGNNLLDTTTTDHINPKEIRVFILKNGVKTELFDPRMAAPRQFLIQDNGSGEKFMKLFLYEGTRDQEVTSTFIQWNTTDEDTLKATMSRSGNSVYCTRILYNDKLKYDAVSAQPVTWGASVFYRFIEVKK